MSKTEKQRIRRVAYMVREWAENYAKNHGFSDTLESMCGIGSYVLWSRLRAAKILAYIVVNDCHAFVEVKGHLVDITATQFGFHRRVILRSFRWLPASSYVYWNIKETGGNDAAIRRIFNTWPARQKPRYGELLRDF